MSRLARILGRTPPPEPAAVDAHANAHCSFCGKPRVEVRKLIFGASVYICDECVGLTVQIVDEEQRRLEGRSYHVDLLLGSVAHGGPRLPHAIATPALRAVIELAAGDPVALRRVFASACRVSDLVTAQASLAAIPADQRTTTDRINLACMLADLGRASDALAALDAIDEAAVPADDTAWFRLTRAYAELERGGLPRPRLAVHRSTALGLESAFAALPPGAFETGLRMQRLAVLALTDLALGELADAEQAARARVELTPDNPSAHEILARVLAARGDHAGAEAARARARECAHPDGYLARRLRDDGPYRA